MKRSLSAGFGAVEMILVVVLVTVVGFVGFRVYEANSEVNKAQEAANKPIATTQEAVPAIRTTEDLDKAEKMLDDTDTAVYEQELSSELNY